MDKAILVYTVSDKDLRNELVEMLRHRGWEEHQDQSTLTLPQDSPSVFNRSEFAEWMENWGRNKNWIKDDFVQVYYPTFQVFKGYRILTLDSVRFSLI